MIQHLLSVATIGLLLIPNGATMARTWIVAQDGSGDFALVTVAYTAAASGDTVLIRPGEYAESDYCPCCRGFGVQNKSLTTIGGGADPDDVKISVRLGFEYCTGIVIENLSFSDSGNPLNIGDGSTAQIRNCVFEGNGTCGDPWGALVLMGPALVEDCVFRGNSQVGNGTKGAAISAWGGHIIIRRCVFDANSSGNDGGAVFVEGSDTQHVRIEECVFLRNQTAREGAAIFAMSGTEIVRCTFWGNKGTSAITTVGFSCSVDHCIVAGTIGGWGVGTYGVSPQCCDFWQNEQGDCGGCLPLHQTGSFALDPLFCDADHGDFGLQDGSPCLDGTAGGWQCGLIGAKGLGCGESPVEPTTWGRIKMVFR